MDKAQHQPDFEEMIRGGAAVLRNPRSQREIDDVKHILSTRQGRRFYYNLLGQCHFGRSAFAGNNEMTNALSGKQLIGEWASDLLNLAFPEAYAMMLKEAKEDEANDRHQSEPARSSSGGSNYQPDAADGSAEQPA
jgi:hypothetical protein